MPVFPARNANAGDLAVAGNLAGTFLTSTIGPSDTIIGVSSTTSFPQPSGSNWATLIEIDTAKSLAEVVRICGMTSVTFIVCSDGHGGRGFDGTGAQAHNNGAQVNGFIVAYHHNQLAAEIIALEAAVAGNGVHPTISPYESSDYTFTRTPGGSIGIGSNTVTLTPVPVGINGADSNHFVYLSGGTGTAEPVLITGGTAVSGASSGTITFTAANTHTGAWTVTSGFCGIPEAAQAAATAGLNRMAIHVPASGGPCVGYGAPAVTLSTSVFTNGIELIGDYHGSSLRKHQTTGDLISIIGTGSIFKVSNFRIEMDVVTAATAGAYIRVNGPSYGIISDIFFVNGWDLIDLVTTPLVQMNNLNSLGHLGKGIYITGTSDWTGVQATNINLSGGAGSFGIYSDGNWQSSEFTNVLLQGGAININVPCSSTGYMHEVTFSNLTLDSATTQAVKIQPVTGCDVFKVVFSNVILGTATSSAAPGFFIDSSSGGTVDNVLINSVVGASDGASASMFFRGCNNCALTNSNIWGTGNVSATRSVWALGAMKSFRLENNTLGFGQDGSTTLGAWEGIEADATAHTDWHVANNRVYGATNAINWNGTGANNVFTGNKWAGVVTQPACNTTIRQSDWYTRGGAGVKDAYQICTKDVADAYAWRTIY